MDCVNEVAKDGRNGCLHWRVGKDPVNPGPPVVVVPRPPLPSLTNFSKAEKQKFWAALSKERARLAKEGYVEEEIDVLADRYKVSYHASFEKLAPGGRVQAYTSTRI